MPKSILLVDDSPTIRILLRSYLESHPGLEVCAEASDGVEAIEKAQRLCPDLIVMDLSMPRMNGLEAARELKQKMPGVPIILFTHHKGALRDSDAKSAGISAIVSKSDEPELLMGQILYFLEPAHKSVAT